MLLSDFLDLIYAAQKPIRDSTIAQYSCVIRSFDAHLGHPSTTSDLTTQNLNSYVRSYSDRYSDHQASVRRNILAALWRLAATTGHAETYTPPRPVRIPPVVVSSLTVEQVSQCVAAASAWTGRFRDTTIPRGPYMSTLIRGIWETSLRQSDIHQLEYEPIVARDGCITIVQHKTSHPRRVRLSRQLLADVARWHDGRRYMWPQIGRRERLGKLFQRLSRDVGFRVTGTLLRKSSITNVERQSPGTGWIHAGHKSPATTQKWYIDDATAYEDLPSPEGL